MPVPAELHRRMVGLVDGAALEPFDWRTFPESPDPAEMIRGGNKWQFLDMVVLSSPSRLKDAICSHRQFAGEEDQDVASSRALTQLFSRQ